MRLYEVELTRRYSVVADSEEHALASYRAAFEGIEPELVGLKPEEVIQQDGFEFLEETGRAVWAGAEQ